MEGQETGGWTHGLRSQAEASVMDTQCGHCCNLLPQPSAPSTSPLLLGHVGKGMGSGSGAQVPTNFSVHLKTSGPMSSFTRLRRAVASLDASRQECLPHLKQKSFVFPYSCHRNASHRMIYSDITQTEAAILTG